MRKIYYSNDNNTYMMMYLLEAKTNQCHIIELVNAIIVWAFRNIHNTVIFYAWIPNCRSTLRLIFLSH